MRVAPRAGAWIETNNRDSQRKILMSRPARARGLKLRCNCINNRTIRVAPRAGAWIETQIGRYLEKSGLSRPARARGLKHFFRIFFKIIIMSRPARARGLKRLLVAGDDVALRRAPRGRVD